MFRRWRARRIMRWAVRLIAANPSRRQIATGDRELDILNQWAADRWLRSTGSMDGFNRLAALNGRAVESRNVKNNTLFSQVELADLEMAIEIENTRQVGDLAPGLSVVENCVIVRLIQHIKYLERVSGHALVV